MSGILEGVNSRIQSRPDSPPSNRAVRSTVWLLVAVLLVAANLRGGITSLGALLDSLDGLSAGTRAFLTSLPVLCFAVVGATGMTLARRLGVHRGIGVALGLLVAGLLVRVIGDPWLLLAGTFVACAGIALANVLLPAVVKEGFPNRVGAVTGAYSAVMSLGAAIAAGVTVPIAHAAGSWRAGLGVWALLAALALLAWLPHLRDRGHRRGGGTRIALWREPTAWAVTVVFGTQSLFAYVVMSWLPSIYADAGFSHATAGLLLAVSILVGVPVFFLAPSLAIRASSQGHLIAVLTALLAIGFAGLWLAPVAGAWLWAVLVGIGGAVFPVALTLFSIRTATTAGTTALSSMAQSIGYLLAAAGPFLVGLLRESTGSWSVPIALLLGLALVQIFAGYVAGRPVVIGDPAED
ncbi:MFS transporter [Nocardioides sp. NPDC127514]|uniref:MFS transporter n=1 Tax=Nocardioides sp. NPDC127514 TaxID=3154243 RepID=UPI003323B2A6